MTFAGKILRDGQVIVDQVSGELFGVDTVWKGNLTVPSGTLIDKAPYDLVLDDGRSGTMTVQAIYIAREHVMIFFDGIGSISHKPTSRFHVRTEEPVSSGLH